MLFPTVAFAVFFCAAFLTNWLLRPHVTPWRLAMVAMSLFFYGYWDPRFVPLLGASIVVNHLAGHAIVVGGRTRTGRAARVALAIGIVANLGILGFFKYYGFFATSVTNGLGRFGIDVAPRLLDITLPIGISFFTFQAIGYLVDLKRGSFHRALSLLDVAFFLSFFPQLVAGPIVRATEMAPQMATRPDPRSIPAGEAFWLIGIGLVKKVVISSYLATNLVDPVFDVPGDHTRFEVLLAIYGYAIQIYADFSGYTDIAIGCALLLGFRFPANFDAPYRALSLRDFWRRWHISLSSWLRDYLYIPLGGDRRGRLLTGRNLAITMVLGGLWHGAAWTFVAWGAMHAALLAGERIMSHLWRPIGFPERAVRASQWFVTFHLVCASWVFFRADTIGQAVDVFGRLIDGTGAPSTITVTIVAVIALSLAAQFVPRETSARWQMAFNGVNPALQVVIGALALTTIDSLGPEGVAPFIYFQF
ncbi:MAG: MBOAT family protein [Actinomycetota bacterium]